MSGGTEQRDLRTGRSLWEIGRPPRLATRSLDRALDCDVVVVGAGVTGAMVAEALTAAGRRVVIIDRRGPCRGSTAASTSLLQFEIDTPLLLLAEKIGASKAARAWTRSAEAVDALASRVRTLGIRCDLRRRSTVYLSGNVLGSRDLQREVALRQRIGLPSVYLDRRAVEQRLGVDRSGAILSTGAAEADPVRLAAGFLRRALRRGARLFAPVEVENVDCGRRAIEVRTPEAVVTCRFVVYATGYELARNVPRKGHKVISTWVIATKPQRRKLWTTGDLIWEASDPYLYLRTTADGRVIAGGEDGDFEDEAKRDALIPTKTARISAKLARMMPELDARPEYRWTGCFGESRTGLPTIGEIPGMKRCYAVLGYGGNGITFSMIAAQIIRRGIGGGRDPDVDLFRFR